MSLRVLLLSAYDAASHRQWRQGLVAQFPDYQWTVLSLSPNNFSWRIHSNSLQWAFDSREVLESEYDLIIATSMTDLSSLRGMVPQLTTTPTIVYFHENQIAYPLSSNMKQDFTPALLNLYTGLCGDAVIFNTEYNRQSFLEGMNKFLRKKMRKKRPPGVLEQIISRSHVLAVPLYDQCFERSLRISRDRHKEPLHILWNHRWEYDKGPDRLFHALYELSERNIAFRLHVAGQQFRKVPSIFYDAQRRLESHIETWGYVETRNQYDALLQQCDVVISTALHDFQGLAVMEAVAAGCHPLVPERLAYQEYIPEKWRYASYPENARKEQRALIDMLAQMCTRPDDLRRQQVPCLQRYSWSQLRPRYEQLFQQLM